MTTLRIGTRGSQLALWQANTVSRLLTERAGVACELVIIRTSGDEPPDAPSGPTSGASPMSGGRAPRAAGPPPEGNPTGAAGPTREASPTSAAGPPRASESQKATFVKEIEDALLAGRVDIAVHSSKDLSAEFPEGLIIGATLSREDPRDAILLPHAEKVSSIDALRDRLGPQPRFGTSSVRRVAQLSRLFPGARFAAIRGNVDTRLRKLDAGECDAGVLASAGLKRLDLGDRIAFALATDVCLPAPGQGVVTIQVRADQPQVRARAATVTDRDAFHALLAERAVVKALGGGCQMPLGAHARIEGDELTLVALVIAADGSQVVRKTARGRREDAEAIGRKVADALVAGGALSVLRT